MSAFMNSAPYKIVAGDAANGRLSHAYLLVCPDVRNLRGFLKELAKLIFGADERVGGLIEREMYADCLVLPAEGSKFTVADAKTVTDESYIKPVEGDKKLFVLDGVQDMNASAQNKLLKVLEEPPENVIIFLAVKNAAAMYDTIKSRVRTVRLDVFSRQEIYDEIVKTASPEKAATAAACADGMLGKALEIATSETYSEVYDKAFWILLNITKSKDISSVLNDKVFSKDNFPVLLDVLSVIFGDVAEVAANPVCAESKQRGDAIKKLAAEFTPKAAAAVIFALNENRKMLNYNTSSVSVAENMLFKILEVKHLCR